MTREEVTEKIRAGKVRNGLSWVSIAEKVGKSPEWTTAACLGQFPFSKEEAEKLGELFNLTNEDVAWLQVIPYRSVKHTVPEDPTLYRLHEAIGVYGPAVKELIHEQFGDGIMSAIDLAVKVEKEENSAGDRVKLTLSGKFLSYKKY